MIKRLFWMLVLGAAGSLCSAQGIAPKVDWGLADLMRMMAQVKHSESVFSEHKTLAYLDAPVLSKGRLSYRAPDYIKKQVMQPRQESYEVSAHQLIVDNGIDAPRQVHLDDYPQIAVFVESFRATLAGDLNSLKRHYWHTLKGTAEDWTLQLEPVDEDVAKFVTRITLHGKGTRLLSIETIESGGDSSVMRIETAHETAHE